MKLALQEYCRDVEERAEQFARAEESRERIEHLQAFNFGRMVQRLEVGRYERWLRIGWLVAGLAIGVALGSAFPGFWSPAPAHAYFAKARLMARDAGRSALGKLRQAPLRECSGGCK